MSGAAVLPAAIFLALALLVVPVFPHFVSPNEMSRWLTAASLVSKGTPEVGSLAPLLGPAFEDLAEKDGRLYSNKAPGLALVSLPGYLLALPLAGPPSARQLRPAVNAMRLVGSTLPALLLAFALDASLAAFGAPFARRRLAVATLLFATPLLAYGLLLFSHALVAASLFGAFALLFAPADERTRARREAWAGALLGLAVLSEVPAAVPAGVLFGASLLRRDGRRALRLAAGAAPFALALGAWNAACFGSPFLLSSGLERSAEFRELSRTGLFGVSLPSPAILARLLFDPVRGLLVFSPVLALALPGALAAWRRIPRDAALALVLAPTAILLTYAGYPNWHGGWTVGARYLVSALPFLAALVGLRDGGRGEALLVGASGAACALATLSFPFVPAGFDFPWVSFSLPLLAHADGVPNLLHLLPLPPGWRGVALAVPLLLAAAGVAAAVPGRRGLALAGSAAALVLPGAFLLARPELPSLVLQRAYVEEVYFERDGAIAAVLPKGIPPPARLLRRRDLERSLPPLPWPF